MHTRLKPIQTPKIIPAFRLPQIHMLYAYASVESLALPLVTLTPSSFARETMEMRFLAETACAIL